MTRPMMVGAALNGAFEDFSAEPPECGFRVVHGAGEGLPGRLGGAAHAFLDGVAECVEADFPFGAHVCYFAGGDTHFVCE